METKLVNNTYKNRRKFIQTTALAAGAMMMPFLSMAASSWPQKPIHLVVAFPAGGPTDMAARLIAQKLSERLGQPVIVENRPGASGSVGTASFIKNKPDGYTLSLFGMPALIAPIVYRNNLYDVRKDFISVSTVYDLPYVIIINTDSLPDVNDLNDLIEVAKTKDIDYSSPGTGSIGHLSMEQLKDLGGFDMLHIPYNGSAPAITDLMGGQISVMFADMIAAMPHIKSGKVKAIALGSEGAKSFLPDVKSIAEQGFPGFESSSWSGLIAPNDTPPEIVKRLNSELAIILDDPEVKQRMNQLGALVTHQSGPEMQQRLNQEYERWNKVANDKNITNS